MTIPYDLAPKLVGKPTARDVGIIVLDEIRAMMAHHFKYFAEFLRSRGESPFDPKQIDKMLREWLEQIKTGKQKEDE